MLIIERVVRPPSEFKLNVMSYSAQVSWKRALFSVLLGCFRVSTVLDVILFCPKLIRERVRQINRRSSF